MSRHISGASLSSLNAYDDMTTGKSHAELLPQLLFPELC